jgi:hypothetical protein
MAVSQVVRTLSLTANGATKGGSLTVAAPASSTALTSTIEVRNCAPEITVTGISFGGTNAASTVRYDCAGKAGKTYPITLSVVDIATA